MTCYRHSELRHVAVIQNPEGVMNLVTGIHWFRCVAPDDVFPVILTPKAEESSYGTHLVIK